MSKSPKSKSRRLLPAVPRTIGLTGSLTGCRNSRSQISVCVSPFQKLESSFLSDRFDCDLEKVRLGLDAEQSVVESAVFEKRVVRRRCPTSWVVIGLAGSVSAAQCRTSGDHCGPIPLQVVVHFSTPGVFAAAAFELALWSGKVVRLDAKVVPFLGKVSRALIAASSAAFSLRICSSRMAASNSASSCLQSRDAIAWPVLSRISLCFLTISSAVRTRAASDLLTFGGPGRGQRGDFCARAAAAPEVKRKYGDVLAGSKISTAVGISSKD